MTANEFDLVVLGGGPGGYVAAIRASQLGMKTAIVERNKLGGVCLHSGCVPSKALLRSAEICHLLSRSSEFGIDAGEITVNFRKMQDRKQKIVEQLHKGVQHLINKGNIKVYYGEGRIMGPSIFSPTAGAVSVTLADGETEILVPRFLLIATGSRPAVPDQLEPDGRCILSCEQALDMAELPKAAVVIGAGTIGVEWASLLNDIGVEVHLIESSEDILSSEDPDIRREMARQFKKRKIIMHTGTVIRTSQIDQDSGIVTLTVEKNGTEITIRAEKVILATGRQANHDNIGLNNTEIKVTDGVIQVNDMYQTKEAHIYAVGDVIGRLQLAHAASREGIIAVEHMAGLSPQKLDYANIAKITYSRPEVAGIGWTEQEAKDAGRDVKTASVPFKAIGKALIEGDNQGFAKMIVDNKTDDILGIHMIGPRVSEFIAEGAFARVMDAAPWEIGLTVHPHPTLSEVMGEVVLALEGKTINL